MKKQLLWGLLLCGIAFLSILVATEVKSGQSCRHCEHLVICKETGSGLYNVDLYCSGCEKKIGYTAKLDKIVNIFRVRSDGGVIIKGQWDLETKDVIVPGAGSIGKVEEVCQAANKAIQHSCEN